MSMQIKQLLQDRSLLMDENQRLRQEVEEMKYMLAYEASMRPVFCRAGHATSSQHGETRSFRQQCVPRLPVQNAEFLLLAESASNAAMMLTKFKESIF